MSLLFAIRRPCNERGPQEPASTQTQRADLRLRRAADLSFAALVVACALSLWALQGWLAGMAHAASPVAQRQLLGAFTGLIGVSCVLVLTLAAYLRRTGARVLAAAHFPPPGMRVIRDTTIVQGSAALRRGRVMQGMGPCWCCAAWHWPLPLGACIHCCRVMRPRGVRITRRLRMRWNDPTRSQAAPSVLAACVSAVLATLWL